MHFSPSSLALQRIHQHFEYVQEIINEKAKHHLSRVQAMSKQFQSSLNRVYELGEGWIEEDVHRILDATQFAADKHQIQLRKDPAQTSYLVHPLSVANHLISVGKVRDVDVVVAGLLHDTLEDTSTSHQELINCFGERVAAFVQEVTDDKSLSKEERKRLQVITAPQKSAGAAQIKLADKWDNLTDLLKYPAMGWSEKRIQAYFEWAKEVVEALPWVNALLLNAVEEVLYKKLS